MRSKRVDDAVTPLVVLHVGVEPAAWTDIEASYVRYGLDTVVERIRSYLEGYVSARLRKEQISSGSGPENRKRQLIPLDRAHLSPADTLRSLALVSAYRLRIAGCSSEYAEPSVRSKTLFIFVVLVGPACSSRLSESCQRDGQQQDRARPSRSS